VDKRMRLGQILAGLAEYFDKRLTPNQIGMYVDDLETLEVHELEQAVARYRREPGADRFPLPAKLIALARPGGDGRPGADEAWAMIPRSEAESVVWTREMASAFNVCRELLQTDEIAARMAFRDAYTRMVAEARADGAPVTWEASLGHDPALRESVLREAVAKRRIKAAHAQALLPSPATIAPAAREIARAALAGPTEGETTADAADRVRAILERLRSKSGEVAS
jgi:hypothetical protein